jgi:hypothetical protein
MFWDEIKNFIGIPEKELIANNFDFISSKTNSSFHFNSIRFPPPHNIANTLNIINPCIHRTIKNLYKATSNRRYIIFCTDFSGHVIFLYSQKNYYPCI